MVEILGNNLKQFFDTIDNPPKDAEITYAGERYEVWEISDELYKRMCDMSEEEFIKLAGEDAYVCTCAIDLAKYNDMTMGELFEKYEG